MDQAALEALLESSDMLLVQLLEPFGSDEAATVRVRVLQPYSARGVSCSQGDELSVWLPRGARLTVDARVVLFCHQRQGRVEAAHYGELVLRSADAAVPLPVAYRDLPERLRQRAREGADRVSTLVELGALEAAFRAPRGAPSQPTAEPPPSELERIRNAILADPEADEPRVRYAQALRALGKDEQAATLERALTTPSPHSHPNKIWGSELGLSGFWVANVRRGFVESVVAEFATSFDLLRVGELEPIVSLTLKGPGINDSPETPEFARHPGRSLAEQLACPWMSRLRALTLQGASAADRAGEVLADAKPLSSITELTLEFCKIDNKAAKALCKAPFELTHFRSGANTFRAPGLKVLLERFGPKLRSLSIVEHRGVDAKFIAALASASLPNLTALELSGPARVNKTPFVFEDAWVSTLCDSANMPELRSLGIKHHLSSQARSELHERLPA